MKYLKRIFVILTISLVVLVAVIFLFMQQKTFGKAPSGARLAKIKQSPNYRDGAFQNLNPTEVTLKSASFFKLLNDFVNKPKNTTPPRTLPSVQTNLKTLPDDKPVLVWFGHSSYLIQVKDVRILVDPVFSGNASPVSFFGKSFPGADVYGVDDLPTIDLVILTHDHYDHLDYQTITQLIPKAAAFYTPLGVGAHLAHWGVAADKITEFDWWDERVFSNSIKLTATPARHFSGRSFTRNQTLWASFVLEIYGYKLFLGGDSGYDTHFKTIGSTYGPFDIALLECGQYGVSWPYIHTTPEEAVTAAQDLQAKVLLPVHWGKFALAYHPWDEPIERVVASAAQKGLRLTTPRIGEPVVLDSVYPQQTWWNLSPQQSPVE